MRIKADQLVTSSSRRVLTDSGDQSTDGKLGRKVNAFLGGNADTTPEKKGYSEFYFKQQEGGEG